MANDMKPVTQSQTPKFLGGGSFLHRFGPTEVLYKRCQLCRCPILQEGDFFLCMPCGANGAMEIQRILERKYVSVTGYEGWRWLSALKNDCSPFVRFASYTRLESNPNAMEGHSQEVMR